VNPTTSDPEDIGAAAVRTKVALRVREVGHPARHEKGDHGALVMDGGYAMPYWDSTVGPFLENGVGVGEVGIRTFTGNEVGWENGVEFDRSPWHVIVQARPLDEMMACPAS
jgi:hypothetical protein